MSDMEMEDTEERHESGFESLGYAVIRKAVNDVKQLTSVGIITNGKPVEKWPKGIKTVGYTNVHQVKELLLWFRNGSLEYWLNLLRSKIDASAIRKQLNIEQAGGD